MKRKIGVVAAVALPPLSSSPVASAGTRAAHRRQHDGKGKTITLWLVGGDTPDTLRDYLKTEFHKETGGTLTIEEQDWGDARHQADDHRCPTPTTPPTSTRSATPSRRPSPTSARSSTSATCTRSSAATTCCSRFVEAGKVDGKNYALPYYFGSRYVFYRKDVWAAAGVDGPDHARRVQHGCRHHRRDEPRRHHELLGLLPRRPGLAQRHLVDLRQRRRPRRRRTATSGSSTLVRPEDASRVSSSCRTLYKNASNAPVDARTDQYIYVNDNDVNNNADDDDADLARGRHDHRSGLGALVDR